MRVLYVAFLLRELTPEDGDLGHFQRAEAALDRCLARAEQDEPWALPHDDHPPVDWLIALHDRQPATMPVYRYRESCERVSERGLYIQILKIQHPWRVVSVNPNEHRKIVIRHRHLERFFSAVLLSTFTFHSAIAQPNKKAMPTDIPRAYFAISNGTSETLGETMKLSRTSAHFSLLRGKMKLRYSGAWKNSDDSDFGGDVYQVLNSNEFFSLNKGKKGFCDKPVRWITIKDLSDDFHEGTIRVGMLATDDWRKYNPNSFDACSADSFTLE
ncbi:hypothetical protein [Burkholderia ubonensis]|uniref:hypothetical protein n=1 Tax=Burkholderia ubonensis TaxID=101571 RepID=UPI000AC4722C|nr:hypothetical protein [Burkholderia ubonensis]